MRCVLTGVLSVYSAVGCWTGTLSIMSSLFSEGQVPLSAPLLLLSARLLVLTKARFITLISTCPSVPFRPVGRLQINYIAFYYLCIYFPLYLQH